MIYVHPGYDARGPFRRGWRRLRHNDASFTLTSVLLPPYFPSFSRNLPQNVIPVPCLPKANWMILDSICIYSALPDWSELCAKPQMKILTSREHFYFPAAREEIFQRCSTPHPTRSALGGITVTCQNSVSAASLFFSLGELESSSKYCVYLTQAFNHLQKKLSWVHHT